MARDNDDNAGLGGVSHQPHGIGKLINRINQEYKRIYGDILIEEADGSLINYVSGGPKYRYLIEMLGNNETIASVEIKGDGKKVYYGDSDGNSTNSIMEVSLAIPYDLRTNTGTVTVDVPDSIRGFQFNPDGTGGLALDNTDYSLINFSLSTAWDITTISFGGGTALPTGQPAYPLHNLSVTPDGTRAYATYGDGFIKAELSVPWNAYQVVDTTTAPIPDEREFDTPTGIAVNADETKAYVVWNSLNDIEVFEFGTPSDITTLKSVGTPFDFAFSEPWPLELVDWDNKLLVGDGGLNNILLFDAHTGF